MEVPRMQERTIPFEDFTLFMKNQGHFGWNLFMDAWDLACVDARSTTRTPVRGRITIRATAKENQFKTRAFGEPLRFRGVDFQEMGEVRGSLQNCVFDNCSFLDCDFRNYSFKDCGFAACVFDNVNFIDAVVNDCDFLGGAFSDVMINKTSLLRSKFHAREGARSPEWYDCILRKSQLRQCELAQQNFERGDWDDVLFEDTSFADVNFSEGKVRETVFRNASLKRTKWALAHIYGNTGNSVEGNCVLRETTGFEELITTYPPQFLLEANGMTRVEF